MPTLTVGTEPAGLDGACFDLYARYIRGRHRDGAMYPPAPSHLRFLLQSEWAGTFFLTARRGERLVAVAVTDTYQPVEEVCSLNRPVQAAWR